MTRRIHVPFDDAWGMQIRPRVSQVVRVGEFGATCGQCDLDTNGQALHAGELWPQVDAVGGHLRRRLDQAGAGPDQVRRLEAFYVGPADEDELRAALWEAVGCKADVLLIPLEHFYYPGMRIELDAIFDSSDRLIFRTGDGDDVESILRQLELPRKSLLAVRVYYRFSAPPTRVGAAAVTSVPLPTLPCRVRLAAIAAAVPPPELVFIPGQLPIDWQGRVVDRGDVAAQTRLVMRHLSSELERAGVGFADLVKVTVHYVGSPRPDDLHRNLEIRSQFYAPPGPSSTGVPVAVLDPEGASLVVEAIAAR